MIEQSSEAEIPAQTGSLVEFEGVEMSAEEAAEMQAGFNQQEEVPVALDEPVVEAAPVAEDAEPQDITFSTLENGEKQVRLATGEVYRGKDDSEVMRKMGMGKIEASRTIHSLKNPPPPPPQAPSPAAQAAEMDATAKIMADYTAQGLGYKNSAEMLEEISLFRSQSQQLGLSMQQQNEAQMMDNFMRATPDFTPTQANAEKIDEILTKLNLPLNADTLHFAHFAAKGQGLYTAAAPPQVAIAAPPRNYMPPPPSGNAPAATGRGNPSIMEQEAMTLEELDSLMLTQ